MIRTSSLSVFACIVVVFGVLSPSMAEVKTWTNSAADDDWGNSNNWSSVSGGVPGTNDIAKFDNTSEGCVIDDDVDVAGIEITSTYTGTITQNFGKRIDVGTSGWTQNGGTFLGGHSSEGTTGLPTIKIQGDFDLDAGRFHSTSGTLVVEGSFLAFGAYDPQTPSAGGFDLNNGILKLDGGSTSNLQINSPGDLKALTIFSGSYTMTSKLHCSVSLTLASSVSNPVVLDLAGYEIEVGTLSNDGTLKFQGDETATITNPDVDSGTVEYYGNNGATSLVGGNEYTNLVLGGTGTWKHSGTLIIHGDLTIGGTTTLNSEDKDVEIHGDWNNSGTYTQNGNSVLLAGGNQTINGSNTFNDLTKIASAARTLTFEAGETQTVNGLLRLRGLSKSVPLDLVSTTPATQWNLAPSTSYDLSGLDVTDSNITNANDLQPFLSTDGGNNDTQWIFANDPTEIANSDLGLWVRADTNVTYDAGTKEVSAWQDVEAARSTIDFNNIAGTKPLLVENELSGEPIIRFDGVTDRMDCTEINHTGDSTMFFLMKVPEANQPALATFLSQYQGNFFSVEMDGTNPGAIRIRHGGGNTNLHTIDTSEYIALTIRVSGTQIDAYVNGAHVVNSTVTSGTASSHTYYIMGLVSSGQYGAMDIAELLVYKDALSSQDQLAVESYLLDRYGLQAEPIVSIDGNASQTADEGTPHEITVTATDLDGSISKVEFFKDSVLWHTDTTFPFSYTWDSPEEGTYQITAVATDNDSNSVTSAAMTLTVGAGSGSGSGSGPLPDNIAIWLKSDVGVVANGSNQVSQWQDQSGNDRHYSQVASTVYQPVLVEDIINGRPVLRFDGVNDWLDYTAAQGTNTESTYFIVFALPSTGTTQFDTLFSTDLGGAGYFQVELNATTSKLRVRQGTTLYEIADTTKSTTSPASDGYVVLKLISRYNAGGTTSDISWEIIALDGQGTDASGTVSLSSKADYHKRSWLGLFYGGTYFMPFDMAEMIVYYRDLGDSSSDTQQVIDYLEDRYKNKAPIISITSPGVGDTVIEGQSLAITVDASDPDSNGSVTKVEYYIRASGTGWPGTPTHTATVAPFGYTVPSAMSGTFDIKAVATDDQDATTESAVVSATSKAAPVISFLKLQDDEDGPTMNPDDIPLVAGTNIYRFTPPSPPAPPGPEDPPVDANLQSYTIQVSATDADGSLTASDIEFYLNNKRIIAEVTDLSSGTYSIPWEHWESPSASSIDSFPLPGTYEFKAVVTDSDGLQAISDTVVFVAREAPTVSWNTTAPTAPAAFTIGDTETLSVDATAPTGASIERVEFRLDVSTSNTLIGTVTQPVSGDQYDFSWANIVTTSGTHTITAIAYDTNGSVGTPTASLSVPFNTPPSVSIVHPLSGWGDDHTAGGTHDDVDLFASVTDPDDTAGSHTVKFFYDDQEITAGTVTYNATYSRYELNWEWAAGVGAGQKTVTATVDDDSSATATSDPIHIYWGAYPASTEKKIVATDPEVSAYFGDQVAIDGQYAVVGAHYDDANAIVNSGAAYVFQRLHGEWVFMQKLSADDGAASDYFGSSVAVAGDYIFVGASADDNENGTDAGSVYVYRITNGSWAQTQKIIDPAGEASDNFGSTAAATEEYLVVGSAEGDKGATEGTGCANVFELGNGTWQHTQKLNGSNSVLDDEFACSVAIDGDTIVIGAKFGDATTPSALLNCGTVYIYDRNESTGVWGDGSDETEMIAANTTDRGASKYFGNSVDISGGYMIVGMYHDSQHGTQSGMAYLFENTGSGWVERDELEAIDPSTSTSFITATDNFGYRVGISGSYAIVTSRNDESTGPVNAGAAYLFNLRINDTNGNLAGGEFVQRLEASDPAVNDYWGQAVAISEDYLIVGSRVDDDTTTDTGSAYLYQHTPRYDPPTATLAITGATGTKPILAIGQQIELAASPTTYPGSMVALVEFFVNGEKVGEGDGNHKLNWTPQYYGNISIKAVVTDQEGKQGQSQTIEAYVNEAVIENQNLAIWLKGHNVEMDTVNHGVKTWYDLASENRHFTDLAGPTRQPKWDGLAVNDKPALLFDGTTDYLQYTSSDPHDGSSTYFIVFKVTDLAQAANRALFSITGASGVVVQLQVDGEDPESLELVVGTETKTLFPVQNIEYTVLSIELSASVVNVYQNGIFLTSVTGFGGLRPQATYRIGTNTAANLPLKSEVAEVLVYDSLLTTQRAGVEQYLLDRYSPKAVVRLPPPAGVQPFPANTPITVTAEILNSVGTITHVEFFDNDQEVGEPVTTAPYSITFENQTALGSGTHVLRAVAVDTKDTSETDDDIRSSYEETTVDVTLPSYNNFDLWLNAEAEGNLIYPLATSSAFYLSSGAESYTLLWADESPQNRSLVSNSSGIYDYAYLKDDVINGKRVFRFVETPVGSSTAFSHLICVRGATYSGDYTAFLVFRANSDGYLNANIFGTDVDGISNETLELVSDGGSPAALHLRTRDELGTIRGYEIGSLPSEMTLITVEVSVGASQNTLKCYRNGSEIVNVSMLPTEAKSIKGYRFSSFAIPANPGLICDVGECIVVKGILNSTDRSIVEEYLMKRYVTVGGDNESPTISAPTAVALEQGGEINEGQGVKISTITSDSDGEVKSVEYYHDTDYIGISEVAPFDFVWNSIPGDSLQIWALATDDDGATTKSSTTNVTVNRRPTINSFSLSPSGTIGGSTSVTISLDDVIDPDNTTGDIDVTIYDGDEVIATGIVDVNDDYQFSTSNLAYGRHEIWAEVADADGAFTQTGKEAIVISEAPSVTLDTPSSNTTVGYGNILAVSASVTPATAPTSPIKKVDLVIGNPIEHVVPMTYVSNDDYTVDWTVNLQFTGTKPIRVRATDELGAEGLSSAVNLTVKDPPQIRWVSPTEDEIADIGSTSLTFQIEQIPHTTPDVDSVEFYVNGVRVSTDLTSPYQHTGWSVLEGRNVIEVVAYDDGTNNEKSSSRISTVVVGVNSIVGDEMKVWLDSKVEPTASGENPVDHWDIRTLPNKKFEDEEGSGFSSPQWAWNEDEIGGHGYLKLRSAAMWWQEATYYHPITKRVFMVVCRIPESQEVFNEGASLFSAGYITNHATNFQIERTFGSVTELKGRTGWTGVSGSSFTFDPEEFFVLTAVIDGLDVQYRINGQYIQTNTFTAGNAPHLHMKYTLGQALYSGGTDATLDCDIASVITFEDSTSVAGFIDDDDIAQVEAYLGAKFGIFTSAPRVEIIAPDISTTGVEKLTTVEDITLEAKVIDIGGAVAKVEFKYGDVVIGEATPVAGQPGQYDLTWDATREVGYHMLVAVATDVNGNVGTSKPIGIIVPDPNATDIELDSDSDDIADAWEQLYFGNLSSATAVSDSDSDGTTDLNEYLNKTNPLVADQAGDHAPAVIGVYPPANGTVAAGDTPVTAVVLYWDKDGDALTVREIRDQFGNDISGGGFSSDYGMEVDLGLLESGDYTYTVVLEDSDANQTELDFTFTVDGDTPVSTASVRSGRYIDPISVDVTVSEDATLYYAFDADVTTGSSSIAVTAGVPATLEVTTGVSTFSTNKVLKFFSVDAAGNEEPIRTEVYYFDVLPDKPADVSVVYNAAQEKSYMTWAGVANHTYNVYRAVGNYDIESLNESRDRGYHPPKRLKVSTGTIDATDASFTDGDPVFGIEVWYGVTAINSNGVESPISSLISMTVPTPAVTPTADEAADRAKQWLIATQNEDGSWGSSVMKQLATSQAVHALSASQDNQYAIYRAAHFLRGTQVRNNDFLARRILALEALGLDTTELKYRLLLRGSFVTEDDGQGGTNLYLDGWGVQSTYLPDAITTALAMRPMTPFVAGITGITVRMMSFLEASVERDGKTLDPRSYENRYGWSPGGATDTYVSSLVYRELNNPVQQNWIIDSQIAGGMIGGGLIDTAGAIIGVSDIKDGDGDGTYNGADALSEAQAIEAKNYIISQQNSDGSWGDKDPYLTALCIQALLVQVPEDLTPPPP